MAEWLLMRAVPPIVRRWRARSPAPAPAPGGGGWLWSARPPAWKLGARRAVSVGLWVVYLGLTVLAVVGGHAVGGFHTAYHAFHCLTFRFHCRSKGPGGAPRDAANGGAAGLPERLHRGGAI